MLIIIWSLADSISMLREDQLPISFNPDFLMMLDIDMSDKDNKSRIVNQYERAWWNGRKPQQLDLSSIDRCLNFHKVQLASSKNGRIQRLPVLASMLANIIRNPLSDDGTSAFKNQCRHCAQYCQICFRTFLIYTVSQIQCHLALRLNGAWICAGPPLSINFMKLPLSRKWPVLLGISSISRARYHQISH